MAIFIILGILAVFILVALALIFFEKRIRVNNSVADNVVPTITAEE